MYGHFNEEMMSHQRSWDPNSGIFVVPIGRPITSPYASLGFFKPTRSSMVSTMGMMLLTITSMALTGTDQAVLPLNDINTWYSES